MLQFIKPLFKRTDDCFAFGINDAVHNLSCFAVDFDDFLGHRLLAFLGLARLVVPQIAEDRCCEIKKFACGSERFQQLTKRRFDLIARNRLAIAWASRLTAEIVGIMFALRSLGKICGHRMIAIGTAQEAPQCEGFVDIKADRRADLTVQAFLNLCVSLEADERLVLGFAHANAPFAQFQISSVKRLSQHYPNALDGHNSPFGFREQWLRFKETLHFGLRFEASACKAFESFDHNRCNWLMAIHHFAATGSFIELVALRFSVNPIAVLRAGAHTVHGLLLVLLSLVLCGARKHVFHEVAVRRIAEHIGGTFQDTARRDDRIAGFAKCHNIASKSRQIVDDNDVRVGTVLA